MREMREGKEGSAKEEVMDEMKEVNRIVNTGPKHGEKPGSSRVERYRKLLIQLKAQKEKKKA